MAIAQQLEPVYQLPWGMKIDFIFKTIWKKDAP